MRLIKKALDWKRANYEKTMEKTMENQKNHVDDYLKIIRFGAKLRAKKPIL